MGAPSLTWTFFSPLESRLSPAPAYVASLGPTRISPLPPNHKFMPPRGAAEIRLSFAPRCKISRNSQHLPRYQPTSKEMSLLQLISHSLKMYKPYSNNGHHTEYSWPRRQSFKIYRGSLEVEYLLPWVSQEEAEGDFPFPLWWVQARL